MKLFYRILNFIAILITIATPTSVYVPIEWLYKIALVHIFAFLILNNSNKFINQKIIPLGIFLNIFILLFVQYAIDMHNFISFFVLILLLVTFKFKNFEFDNGILVKTDKYWIASYVILLAIWFLLLPYHYVSLYSKIGLILLLLYPLLFPLNEYFLHRAASLTIIVALNCYLWRK